MRWYSLQAFKELKNMRKSKKEVSLEDVKQNLELIGRTARVNFMELKDGRLGFFAESYKSKEKVSIELNKKDIKQLLAFLHRLKAVVSNEVA